MVYEMVESVLEKMPSMGGSLQRLGIVRLDRL